MMGKFIIGSSLVWGTLGATCTQSTWDAIAALFADVDLSGADSYFLQSPSAADAVDIVLSPLIADIYEHAEEYVCKQCFEKKFSSLYEFYNDQVAECMGTKRDTCMTYLTDAEAEFAACKRVYVDAPTKYRVKAEISTAVAGVDEYRYAKMAVSGVDYVDLLTAEVAKAVVEVTKEPVWPCYEIREAATYPVYAKKPPLAPWPEVKLTVSTLWRSRRLGPSAPMARRRQLKWRPPRP